MACRGSGVRVSLAPSTVHRRTTTARPRAGFFVGRQAPAWATAAVAPATTTTSPRRHQACTPCTPKHWYPLLLFRHVHPFAGRRPRQQGTGLPTQGKCHEHPRPHPRADPEGPAPPSGPTRQREQELDADLLIAARSLQAPPQGAPFSCPPTAAAARRQDGNSTAATVAPAQDHSAGHRPRSRADGCPGAAGQWRPPPAAGCSGAADSAGRSH